MEMASNELISFDHKARIMLGSTSASLGPRSSILLRTESASSAQIENLTVDARQLALVELQLASSQNTSTVSANGRAMEAALALADELSSDAILKMHAELLQGRPRREIHAETYRDQLVRVGSSGASPRGASYVVPQSALIPELIEDLCAFMVRVDLPSILQRVIAHAQFDTVYPVVDDKGRTGRVPSSFLAKGARSGPVNNCTGIRRAVAQ
ncbi:hypothetical protein CQ010_18515 [Arthrobacter sp. MYb211]|nr:hypothetical protein CQ015_18480 [Arthrobacter sp. MYb221]PRC01576.1 hypothetical protein CQ010_18515 [Arthrobacter sp. MYb211]